MPLLVTWERFNNSKVSSNLLSATDQFTMLQLVMNSIELKRNEVTQVMCTICEEELWDDENIFYAKNLKKEIVKMECGCRRVYHKYETFWEISKKIFLNLTLSRECLFTWVKKNNVCPLCRESAASPV